MKTDRKSYVGELDKMVQEYLDKRSTSLTKDEIAEAMHFIANFHYEWLLGKETDAGMNKRKETKDESGSKE